jgi:hypothetical protein
MLRHAAMSSLCLLRYTHRAQIDDCSLREAAPMVRCAQFASIFRLALVLGALIAPTCSALATDRSSDPLQRLYEWRARAQALQPAAEIHSPGPATPERTCVPQAKADASRT